MKKDSIIDIISNDLKEMQLLLDNFRGDEPIPTAFIDLLSAKHNNIGKEVELLAFWSEEKTKVKVEEVDSYVVEKETKVEVQLENDLCEPEYADKTNENDRVEEKQEDPKPIEIAKVIEKVEQPKSEIVQSQKAKNSTKASDVKMYGTPVSDIKKIADTYHNYQNNDNYEDIKGFCYSATIDEIKNNDYVLTPGRYVGVEDNNEDSIPFEEKMKNITSELSTQFEESHRLEEEIKKNLKAIGYDI